MEWLAGINWVDLAIIVLLIRGAHVGSIRGFFGELFYIVSIFLIILFALHFYLPLSDFLNKYAFIPEEMSGLSAFLVISIPIYIGLRFLYLALTKLVKLEIFPNFSKVGGMILGLLKGFGVSIILIFSLLLIPLEYITVSVKEKSAIAPFLAREGKAAYHSFMRGMPIAKPKDLSQLLNGAKPIKFRIFRLKRKGEPEELIE